MAKAAFIGLGVMGYPMAGYLTKAGHEVTVYNRTAAKVDKWVAEHGHKSAPTPREAATECDFVMVCVGNDDDLYSVTTGEQGVLHSMKPGAVLVDHTTASATAARTLYAAA
ncbi:MAG: NAD(P)-binding domain-containing protein, partial [Pseudomonadota bacterium]